MKAGEAKKILKCSYSTLHNYVANGSLKLNSDKTYDVQSVIELARKLYGYQNDAIITISIDNKKYEFKLDKNIMKKIMCIIEHDMIGEDNEIHNI